MNNALQKVVAVKDDSGHWYVIPKNRQDMFFIDLEDENDFFDQMWGQYRTGGDLNLIQLWAELPNPINHDTNKN